MSDTDIARSRKADAARRQLGTALHLWLAELDPVSVHVLATGGCEVARALAKKVGRPFSAFALEVHPGMTDGELVRLRNMFWNAMKHANHKDGRERDDEQLLTTPLESDNEARLFEGWYDLQQVMPTPIEAQVLTVWSLAKHGNPDELGEAIHKLFPNIQSMTQDRQKGLLLEKIDLVRTMNDVMADGTTDARPLILPAFASAGG